MKRNLFIALSILIMTYSCNSKPDNPFFAEFDTHNGIPPFDQIRNEHFMPAFEEAMKQQNKEVEAIINNSETPTFENTVFSMDHSVKMLIRVS